MSTARCRPWFLTKKGERILRSIHSSSITNEFGEVKNIGKLSSHECSYPIAGKKLSYKTLQEAVENVQSGNHVYVQGIAATPTPLLSGLCKHAKDNNLKNITLHHIHLEGPTPWATDEYKGIIRSNSLFTGANLRSSVNNGITDFNSVFLSEIPMLFKRRLINLDVALIHVSLPDSRGFCSLGTSVDCTRSAIINAKYIIALANPNMPRTFGDGIIHSSHIDAMVLCNDPLHERPTSQLGKQEQRIGQMIAENLVEDGATLQMGIGAIPDAALVALKDHKHLGIHTEMFSDGILDLVERNAITNAYKTIHPGKIVSGFVYGSRKLYDFLDDNPMILFGDVSWVNDTSLIRQNPKVTAINSAIEIDLTGQVVADSVGSRFLSGFGGQIDFIRGAALCNDGKGKPIIALPSQTKKGESKVVPFIKEEAGVVTTRAHVHYVVTEFGIAQLFGRNMRQRAYELIKIAHPDHRQRLEKAAFDRLKVMPSPD